MRFREFTIAAPYPYSLKATVLSHGWHECAPMGWCEGGECFQVIDRIKDRAVRISITELRTAVDQVTLRVVLDGESIGDADGERFRRDVRLVLGLDRDLTEFHALCANHPVLHVVPRIGAGRIVRSASMTENIIKALLSTNVNWTQAVKMINRLGQLGPYIPHFRNLNAWPTPREILRAGETYLLEVCRVGYRAESVLAFCRDVCAGRIDPDALTEQADDPATTSDELLAQLRSIRGIGPSSAHYLLGFLGRHDRLSIDSATVAHVARTHLKGRRPTNRQIEKIYAPYGAWKNLVYWYESWLTWASAKGIMSEKLGAPSRAVRVAR